MSKKKQKKKSDENSLLKAVVLITATLNLINAILEIIQSLTD